MDRDGHKDSIGRGANQLDPQELLKLIEIGQELRRAMEMGDKEKEKELESSKGMLLMLLEYLILNMDNPNIDVSLIAYLEKFLGIRVSKDKSKEKHEEKEEELTEEQKKHRYRMMIYEIYKIMNPNRLAGETAVENFINNVKTRGMKEAMKYEGHEFSKHFKAEHLENLESHKHSFVSAMREGGVKGGGRGL